MRKLFITGIGTDVGKTVVSAVLVEALKADYWKPVQAGNFFTTDSATVKKLLSNPVSVIHPEAYSFSQPISPFAAAESEGITIDTNNINLPASTNKTLIIEGAGGVLVPLNDKEVIADLIRKFEAETILVVSDYVGSVNHTMLTVEALRSRNINVYGLIFNGKAHQLSEEFILSHSGLRCLGRIGKEKEITKEVVSKYAKSFSSI